ncbi:MAG: hypothetical protein HFI34_06360 [Lachnospiraceae bacterium]|nr:hypothetical protein [Lachnospiraceae bacterium]
MIIGFWSDRAGIGGTTSNMIITGVMAAKETDREVILIQGKYDILKLDYAFSPGIRNDILKEDFGYYNHPGIDDVLEKHMNNLYTGKDFYENLISVNQSNLLYMPGSIRNNPDLFRQKFQRVSQRFFKALKGLDKLIFIELDSGMESLGRHMLNLLDLIVVNIGQGSKMIHDIKNQPILMEKALFLIGRYDSNSKYNVRNMIRRQRINEDFVAVIPYSVKYQDSVNEGKTMEFVNRHYKCLKYEEDFSFFKEAGKASKMILKRVNSIGT